MSSGNQINRPASDRIKELDLLTTIPELLTHHLDIRPDNVIYKAYDNAAKIWKDITVRNVCHTVNAWQHAFAARPSLQRGDRIAMLLTNCPEAVYFDLSVLSNAMVPVPLHAIDTPKSSAFILNDSEAKVLVTNKLLKWKQIRRVGDFPHLELVVIVDDKNCDDPDAPIPVLSLETFLEQGKGSVLPAEGPKPDDLAALVYTSGTTGNPKGVMLTHENVLANIRGILEYLKPRESETWLSFLPLSHTLERTSSYYLSLGLGLTTAFNRSITTLFEDLRQIRPSMLMSVPRIYEMVHKKFQDEIAKKSGLARYMHDWAVEVGWRRFCRTNGLPVEKTMRAVLDPFVAGFLDRRVGRQLRKLFGDNVHLFFSGGAALSKNVAKTFVAFGINILEGYGLTETAPAISMNFVGANHPGTLGKALPNLEVRLGQGNELQVRGPSIMQGYWNREDATRETFEEGGWFKTGDVGNIEPDGRITITGRIKEIIVTSTGEKVPPADLEAAIENDRLFSQSLVLGDDRPFISALTVVNPEEWKSVCEDLGLDPTDEASLRDSKMKKLALRRIKAATAGFPNYGVPRQVTLIRESWTVNNGMLTPTMKKKRRIIIGKYADSIEMMYSVLNNKH